MGTLRNCVTRLYFLACFLAGLLHCAGDIEQELYKCCGIGTTWGTNHSTCTGPPTPIPDIPAENRQTCTTAMYICCIRVHRQLYCERGKKNARVGHTCTALPTPGGEAQKDCCDACTMGLRAGNRRHPCVFESFQFGNPWDEVYSECCRNTSPNTEGGLNRCHGANPCSQICTMVDQRIQCSCYQGYQLSADKQNCEDANECELRTHTCNVVTDDCLNSIGGFQCVAKNSSLRPREHVRPGHCPPGYVRNHETKGCDDIDECLLDVCPSNEVCTNTVGSYICVSRSPGNNCPAGFRLNTQINRCIDIDECAEAVHDCDPQEELCLNSHGAYQCQQKSPRAKDCPAGLKWSTTEGKCEDVDECGEDKHTCNRETQTCLNTVGSYQCRSKTPICPFGYISKTSTTGSTCEDINECLEAIDDCDRTKQYCINTNGGFQCQNKIIPPVPKCGKGFASDVSGYCRDIDECETERTCGPDQTCENSVGSYKCLCQQGFSMDAITRTCKDVNECQLSLHTCTESQRCDNTMGSFTCVRTTSCGTGYTLNAHMDECEDDDECLLSTHNCGPGFACRNTLGSFRCDRVRCPVGQKLLSDGTCEIVSCNTGMEPDPSGNCIDINECAINHVCRKNQRCINTVGSFICQNLIHCSSGYEQNEYGTQCIDVDECARRLAECGPQQTCRNRPGGYTCECPIGYTLNNNRQCEDVDECTRFKDQICSVISECENTQGSYVCHCKQGYKRAEDGRNCIDVDECTDSPGICQQTCINVWGSYRCSCQQGYTLALDERSCQDVDECTLWEGRGSLCIGHCVNEPGSYSCTCPEGYTLGNDKRTCQDIDECKEQNVCRGENEVCLNTRGSFKCNLISCPENYVKDRDHRNRCKRSQTNCRNDDAECLKEPLSFSYNYITFVSNMRIPQSGHLDLFTMRGPRFTFTTVQFQLELIEANAQQGVQTATKDYFHLRRTAANEAMVSLVKPIQGPQEVELELIMKMYHHGNFGGTAIAKLFIFVTSHEF